MNTRMKFSTASLEKALSQLDKSLQYLDSAIDPGLREQFRAAVIQAFEFSFELSWKMIKRYLEQFSIEKVDGFTAKQLFRVAHEQGLVRSAEPWFKYLEKRNLTSHTYDGTIAERVYEGAKEFLGDAQFLRDRLKEKTA
jgi:nucleotidyltransferase substrate binding protein (TIGR01987 family)